MKNIYTRFQTSMHLCVMRKQFLVTVFLSLLVSGVVAQSSTGFVHQQGKMVLGGNNQPMQLQGVNLGGWLLWEGWIWGGGFDSQTTVYKAIVKASDSLYAIQFQDSVYRSFIRQADLDAIKGLGLNCVRIPFNHTVLEYKQSGDSLNFELLDRAIEMCRKAGLYAILDMHAAPGGQNKYFTCDPDVVDLWSSKTNQDKTVDLWKAIANHFKNDTVVAAYDLLNEPNIKDNGQLVAFYQRLIASVRSVDTNHMVILEGNKFARDFSFFPKNMDKNMLYSFHFYPWYQGINKRKMTLKNYSDQATYFNVPFWCGEWGEDDRLNLIRNRNFLCTPSFGFVGSAFWTWKSVKYRKRPNLNNIRVSKDVGLVMNGYKPKETGESKLVLEEFLKEMSIDRTKDSKELYRILKSVTTPNVPLK